MNFETIAIVYYLGMTALFCLQATFSYRERMAFPSQMMIIARNCRISMPFVGHGGMWGDFFIVTPLTSLMIGLTVHQWKLESFVLVLALSLVGSSAVHLHWSKGCVPDCLAGNGRVTQAGLVHTYYTAIALTVVIMFYFTKNIVSHRFIVLSSILLSIHIFLGTHKVPDLMATIGKPFWWWQRKLSEDTQGTFTIVILFVILWMTSGYNMRH